MSGHSPRRKLELADPGLLLLASLDHAEGLLVRLLTTLEGNTGTSLHVSFPTLATGLARVVGDGLHFLDVLRNELPLFLLDLLQNLVDLLVCLLDGFEECSVLLRSQSRNLCRLINWREKSRRDTGVRARYSHHPRASHLSPPRGACRCG